MSANEVLDFFTAPIRFDVVLRKEEEQQRALLDLLQELVVEIVARPQLVVDEESFVEDVGTDVEIRGKSGDPTSVGNRSVRNAVVRVGIADEDVESRASDQLSSEAIER